MKEGDIIMCNEAFKSGACKYYRKPELFYQGPSLYKILTEVVDDPAIPQGESCEGCTYFAYRDVGIYDCFFNGRELRVAGGFCLRLNDIIFTDSIIKDKARYKKHPDCAIQTVLTPIERASLLNLLRMYNAIYGTNGRSMA